MKKTQKNAKAPVAGAPGNLARLAHGYWKEGRWLDFADLLEAHGEAKALAPYVPYEPYALYNALTEALFERNDYPGVPALARKLAEAAKGHDDPKKNVFLDCAAIALDCPKVMGPGFAPAKLRAKPKDLPACWAAMRGRQRADLPAAAAARFAGRKELVGKLGRRLARLPASRYDAPFANFANLAGDLLASAFTLGEASVFAAARDLAVLMGRVRKAQGEGERPLQESFFRGVDLANVLARLPHKAVSTMAGRFLGLAALAFGKPWLDAFKIRYLMGPGHDPEILAIYGRVREARPFSRLTALREISRWGGWTPIERLAMANLTLEAIRDAYLPGWPGPDDLDPGMVAELTSALGQAAGPHAPHAHTGAGVANEVFSDFVRANPGLFLPLDDRYPGLDALRPDVFVTLWLFSQGDRPKFDEHIDRTGLRLDYSGPGELEALTLNAFDYHSRYRGDAGNDLFARLPRLREMSRPDSFSGLLAGILGLALRRCAGTQDDPRKDPGFWFHCVGHKALFVENLPPGPIVRLLGLVNPDRTMDPRYLPGVLADLEALEDSPEDSDYAFAALFALAALGNPDPRLMAKLFMAALPRFEAEESKGGELAEAINLTRAPKEASVIFDAMVKPIAAFLSHGESSYLAGTAYCCLNTFKNEINAA
ncbi:MAG: hypothetical protein LBF58_03950 [Deltaproteobacteria bacterium]|jgi:hypothetical protein|nr:hypothetical protein [Deltaproteobacteria bacterium]